MYCYRVMQYYTGEWDTEKLFSNSFMADNYILANPDRYLKMHLYSTEQPKELSPEDDPASEIKKKLKKVYKMHLFSAEETAAYRAVHLKRREKFNIERGVGSTVRISYIGWDKDGNEITHSTS